MKKLLWLLPLVWLFMALLCVNAQAAEYLACDWPVDSTLIASSEVEVNGVLQPGTFVHDGIYCLLLNISGFPKGSVTFRARFLSTGGWPSEWNAPFSDGKPDVPGGALRVLRK